MSIPLDSPWRGCAAYFAQPVCEIDELAAQCLNEHVYYFNCRIAKEPLVDIEYRDSSEELDIRSHVFRWDVTPYQQVFENGFSARRQEGTSDEIFFNLDYYVHHSGRPLDSTRATTHAFVSTTIKSDWNPSLPKPGTELQVYRYEIYAPGGILIRDTFGDSYKYCSQDEVCFVAGIASQYIRSAQLFRLVRELNSWHTRRVRVDNSIILNRYFNPQTHWNRQMRILRPICYYKDDIGDRKSLEIFTYMGNRSSQVSGDDSERRCFKHSISMSQDSSQEDKQQIDGALPTGGKNIKHYYFRKKFKHHERKHLENVTYMGKSSSQVSGDNNIERKLPKRFIYTSQDTSQEDKQQIDGALPQSDKHFKKYYCRKKFKQHERKRLENVTYMGKSSS